MWKLIQYLIVVMSNVHWQWTHNPFAAGLFGVGAAFCFTVLWVKFLDLLLAVRSHASSAAERGT